MSRPDPSPREARKRVFFHVGAPKTGTTYLQNVLFQNRDALADAGVLYPYTDRGQSFRSMQDFRGASWGAQGAEAFRGEWETVAERCRSWQGHTVIVSNELLGGSSVDRIERGVRSVTEDAVGGPVEVHVVFTARDLARQLVSDWQEHVKHKHTVTLEKFVDDLIELGLDAPAPFGELFWGMHDATYVLGRWAGDVPVENIHLITVPHPGGPRDALWRRFCSVVGLDPEAYETQTDRANISMGVAETELLRRMNVEVKDMDPGAYDLLARQYLGEQVLGNTSGKLTLPPGRMDWVTERSARLVGELRAAGYPVTGDLEELMPRPGDHEPHVSPTGLTEADLAAASFRAATALLRRAGRMRVRIRELEAGPGAPAEPRRRGPRTLARAAARRARGVARRAVGRRA